MLDLDCRFGSWDVVYGLNAAKMFTHEHKQSKVVDVQCFLHGDRIEMDQLQNNSARALIGRAG